MRCRGRIASLAALLAAASPASASTVDGILTLLVGLPLLMVVALALGSLLRRPFPRRTRAWLACIFAVPTLYAVYLIPDALSVLERGTRVDRIMAGVFFLMLFVVTGLGLQLLRGRPGR